MADVSIIFAIFWPLIWTLFAFYCILCGVRIYRGNVEMIAGFYMRYDPNKVADEEGLAKWVVS
jgi:hypothetical protein